MKFRRDAPLVLIVAVALVIAGMTAISSRLFAHQAAAAEDGQFDLMSRILDAELRSAESRAQARADMIASIPMVRDTFAARDREKLLQELGPMFAAQKEKYGVDQAQFHEPPAISFLRIHKPEQYGDDLSSFRPLVVEANRSKKAVKGLAIARTGPAIFGVVPVNDAQGQHIGTFEFGIDFGGVLDAVKAAYGLEAVFFVDEETLKTAATSVNKEVFSDQNRMGRYLKFHSTNWALWQNLISDRDLDARERTTYVREAVGSPYGVVLLPLRNAAGNPMGVVAVARDLGPGRADAARARVWQVLVAIASITLLAGFVLVVLRGYLLRPIQTFAVRLEELSRGEGKPIDEEDLPCLEMKELAEPYERLRMRQNLASTEQAA